MTRSSALLKAIAKDATTVAAVLVCTVAAFAANAHRGLQPDAARRLAGDRDGDLAGMKLPDWLRLQPTARADLAFIRRWAWALAAPWVLVSLAAWKLPDSTYHDTKPVIEISFWVVLFCCWLLPPENCTRLRRAGLVYCLSFLIYGMMHNLRWWALGQ